MTLSAHQSTARAREGEIRRAVILLCILYAAAGGLLTYWLAGMTAVPR